MQNIPPTQAATSHRFIPTRYPSDNMVVSERSQSQSRPDELLTSIEDDGAVPADQWKAMTDVITAIYDFREAE